jgi:hypothetical protein
MMRRRSATILLALLAASTALDGAPAFGRERGPVCREPSVVDEITREVRARNYYANVDPDLVTEQPTADPRILHCDVCVLSAPYDTIRYGDRPIASCVARGFEVLTVTNGFVVRALP